MKSIFKWAGGKSRIMPALKIVLPKGERLIEPFCGSCSVMFNTDYKEYIQADINNDLISSYKAIIDNPDDVINCLESLYDGGDRAYIYNEMRDLFNRKTQDKFMQSALFIYLNRFGYNGLCRYNKKGEYNVPMGRYKSVYLPEKEIRRLYEMKDKVTFLSCGYEDSLSVARDGDVIYCDPPYLGKFSSYHKSGFSLNDHESLAIRVSDISSSVGVPVVISNSIEAEGIYKDLGFDILYVDANRTISCGKRGDVTEIIATKGV